MHEDSKTRLGAIIEEMENFRFLLETVRNSPDSMYVRAMRDRLPEWIETLKGVHLLEHGENKWSRGA